MAGEVLIPITVPDTSDKEKEAYRVINDNFLMFSRRINDMREWIDSDKIAVAAITAEKIAADTITADKYAELRNTYVFSDQDSLDASYPFEMDFEIVSEMTAINTVKLSFRIREFRAYSTAVPSGGGHTTASGGGHTTPSGGTHTTPSGGGHTSSAASHSHPGSTADGGNHRHSHDWTTEATSIVDGHSHGYYWTNAVSPYSGDHSHALNISSSGSHSHTVSNHTHTVSDHTHAVSDHQHAVSNHTHSLTFGIYEDTQTPTLNVYIGNDGTNYGNSIGEYSTDQLDIDITSHISGTGFKRVKFTTDVRCRISAWTLQKIDLTA